MDSSGARKLKRYFKSIKKHDVFKVLKKKKWLFLLLFLVLLPLLTSLPKPLFKQPYATVIRSQNGTLLSAKIAKDEQWRFPPLDSIPEKFIIASRLFEDEYFYKHPGINPVSILRAFSQNLKAGSIVSGGSTITMQTIRMALGNQKRTLFQKSIEILKSLKLELTHSKEAIFKSYANHAPFGGNIVGLNAASWRYYAKPPQRLSWAEVATLAVLPNNPKQVFPGKNQEKLLSKRNCLLDKIHSRAWISSEDLELYKMEPLPQKFIPFPNHAPHLLQRSIAENHEGKNSTTTLNYELQTKVSQELNRYSRILSNREIQNAAAIVVAIDSGEVLAYVGNTSNGNSHGNYVDIITAPRSPGSLLKPFLYAAAIDESLILPKELLPDIPLFYRGFIPKNFDKKFRGAVNADVALTTSLNVPFVNLLVDYGQEKFYTLLQKIGYKQFNFSPSHYGLSLILGGAEASLWELSGMYAGMARAYKAYFKRPIGLGYSDTDYHENHYLQQTGQNRENPPLKKTALFEIHALEATFTALEKLKRPEESAGWNSFRSANQIAWKTGTSFGFKDAWAIGVNKNYLVGVWVGNADGEGRPDLVGTRTAAPLMFNLFAHVKDASLLEMESIGALEKICLESGKIASENCENTLQMNLSEQQITNGKSCNYHQKLNLNAEMTHQVNSSCYAVSKIKSKKWWVLPPAQSWYYKKYHPNYALPPPLLEGCITAFNQKQMQLIYPHAAAIIQIPKEQSGARGKVIFHAAHNERKSQVYWYMDETFLGSTTSDHQLEINAKEGEHELRLVDTNGNEISSRFTIAN